MEIDKKIKSDIAFLLGLQKDKVEKKSNYYDMNLFKSSFVNKIKALDRKGDQESINAILDYFEETNKKVDLPPVFTPNHSIWNYRTKKMDKEEVFESNTDDEFYDVIFSQIDAHDSWYGNLIKERDIKRQIAQLVRNGKEEPTTEEVEEIFEIYKKRFTNQNKETKTMEIDKLKLIKDFFGKGQYEVVKSNLDSYEEVIDDLYSTITTMPKTYETDGIPKLKKIAYLHYFSSSSDWYILEKDVEEEQLQAFGFTILNGDMENAELGYINIEELKQYVELDFYFDPKPLSEIIGEIIGEDIEEDIEEENDIEEEDNIENYEKQMTIDSVEKKESIPGIKTDIQSYKNPYEINKAIERLLEQKGDSDNYSNDELEFISYYSGYGGLEKFGEIGIERMKGLMYEFYTPDAVVKKMWALAYKYGYGTIADNSVFEPSVGIGAFLKYAPKDVKLVANEINEYSAKICEILYPNARVELKYFEQNFLKSNLSIKNKTENLEKYSLVIGNPPYGKLDSKYISMGEDSFTKAGNFTEYFITRGLDLLVQGGLLIYIVGAEQYNGGSLFLDSPLSKVKEIIFDKADLIDAYRLPINIFERTGVSSEIVVFKKR